MEQDGARERYWWRNLIAICVAMVATQIAFNFAEPFLPLFGMPAVFLCTGVFYALGFGWGLIGMRPRPTTPSPAPASNAAPDGSRA